MRKIGIAIFHKDLYRIYKPRWINKCLNSIAQQEFVHTILDPVVVELIYGEEHQYNNKFITDKLPFYYRKRFYKQKLNNHGEATNFCFNKLVEEGCEYLFIVHLDDYYDINRFWKQSDALDGGFDLVSSNIQYITDKDGNDISHHIQPPFFSTFNGRILEELNSNHNVIANPVIAMTSEFWEKNRPFNPLLVPQEDFDMYKRGIQNGAHCKILADTLCYYRIHDNQASAKDRKDIK